MRSTLERMTDKELIDLVETLDSEFDRAMCDPRATWEEQDDYFRAENLVIEELNIRGIQGWWSKTKI